MSPKFAFMCVICDKGGLDIALGDFSGFSSSSDRRSGESNCASQHSWVSSSSCDSTSSGGGFELLLFPSVVRWPPRRRHLPILLLEVEDMLGRMLLGWRWCGGGRSSAKTSEKWLQWCETTDVMSELWWWKDNFYEEDEGGLKKNRQDVYFRPQWGWHRDCNKGLYYLFTQNSKKTWAALKVVQVQSFFSF